MPRPPREPSRGRLGRLGSAALALLAVAILCGLFLVVHMTSLADYPDPFCDRNLPAWFPRW